MDDEFNNFCKSLKEQKYPDMIKRAKDNKTKQIKLGENMQQEIKCKNCGKQMRQDIDYGQGEKFCNEKCYGEYITDGEN